MIQSEIHNVQIEQAVLAALMTVKNSYSEVESNLTEIEFYATRHKAIFKAIVDLDSQNKPYDTVMVHDWLFNHKQLEIVGGESYLLELMSEAPSSFYNLDQYVDKLKDLSTCRAVESEAQQIIRNAKNLTVSRGDLVLNAQTAFAEIDTCSKNDALFSMHDAASNTFKYISDKIEASLKGESLFKGIQTGLYDLDQKTGDIEPGHLTVVAARPGMGKTTMLQTMASYVAITQGKPTLIMSGEMPKEQIAMRMCCAIGPANFGLVRNSPHLLPQDEFSNYTKAVTLLHNVPLFINDTKRPSLSNIRESMRKMMHVHGSIGAVFVDYLQLMRTSGKFARADQEISHITKELKAMSGEFNTPIILLSQLNRELEKRPNKRPVMSDLRESGAIEEDADQIIFLYRDEVYNKDSKYKGIAEAIVAKNRHGEPGTAYLHSQLQYCQFNNLDQDAIVQIQGLGGGV